MPLMNKHVIQVYHHDPCDKGKGGAVRYLNNLLRYLPQKGVKVILFGVDITECQKDVQNVLFIPIVKGSNAWWRYLINLAIKLPFIKLPKNSIVHIHRIEYVLPFILWKRKNPVVLTLHGERLATARSMVSKRFFIFIDLAYRMLEYFAFKRANTIISVSNKVGVSYEKVHPWVSNKIMVIPVGIDTNKFRPLDRNYLREKYRIDKNAKVILFAGVLRPVKNIELLLRAFKYVLQKYPEAVLIIVGDGPSRYSLEKLSENLGVRAKVAFWGEVPNEKMPEVYNIADVFALPSLSEGSPTVVREALACGIPVVSTNVGDVREIITDSQLGAVVNTHTDEKIFAEALIKTIRNLEKNREEIKRKCRDVAKRYSFEEVVEEYAKIYEKLLEKKNK